MTDQTTPLRRKVPSPSKDGPTAAGPDHPVPDLTRRGALTAGALGLAAGASVFASAAAAQTLAAPAPMAGRTDPDGRFAGKVVLVTGGTYGIGQTTAEAFAREGARVVFCGRSTDLGAAVEAGITEAGGKALFVAADVRQDGDVRALVDAVMDRYGRIDIAFNNAGYFMDLADDKNPDLVPAPIAQTSDAHWQTVMDTNAGGVFRCMRAEIPVMLDQGGGVIINNASVSGHTAFPGMGGYAASKHAVIGLTKVAAAEVGAQNIRVVSLSPLAVDTPMLRASFAHFDIDFDVAAEANPFDRINTTDEMARVVMFLASDDATSLGGTDIDVTGGWITR
ncbi:MAG: SDR family oxidoreductase [Pseudomonadota bacterium]